MSNDSSQRVIRLRGVRQNNLKNFDLDLPLNRLIVLTGVSGSGKSSLAFDTLFAEGQRRYIETFSPYARQFFDRMDKPQVTEIDGIPPAIALEQRNAVRTTRSTVGTMTEICDYMKAVWLHLAQLFCRKCGRPVRKDTPQSIYQSLPGGADLIVTFDLPVSAKLTLEETLRLIGRQGYQRVLIGNTPKRLEEALPQLINDAPASLTVVQDRLRLSPTNRSRFVEACEQAYHFGKGRLSVHPDAAKPGNLLRFSQHLHCAFCDIEYREPVPALFSFNHPLGACPTCRGFGRIITIDYGLALPIRTKTLTEGVVKPWLSGQGAECQADLLRFAKKRGVPVDVPFLDLPQHWQDWVIEGDPGYGKDADHEWPRAWYGVKGYFRWLESKAYKMHVRVLLSRYRAYSDCPDCGGQRLQPEALCYRAARGSLDGQTNSRTPRADCSTQAPEVPGMSLADVYSMSARDALAWISEKLASHSGRPNDPVGLALRDVQSRLSYLVEVGLGYLTLNRPTRTLSGGETQRVNLTLCLGTRLVNTLYVLDEPSVGLHPRDTERLIRTLLELRDLGNTIVVVEHEPNLIRAADEIVDLGPRQGEQGGRVVFQGTYGRLIKSRASITGAYLGGKRSIEILARRPVKTTTPSLNIRNANRFNLKNLDVTLPLGRLVCVTGVSGSGKTTLVREIIHPWLTAALGPTSMAGGSQPEEDGEESPAMRDTGGNASLTGSELLGRVLLVDQTPIGRTPRSNPAVYTGAFEAIRELFAQSTAARQHGLKASAFSFNSLQGQCERCRGAGFEKIEMQFLSDVYVRCPDCQGRRYRPHILEVRLQVAPPSKTERAGPPTRKPANRESSAVSWGIADFLEATVEDVLEILTGFGESRPAKHARGALQLLQEVGLGYLRLGQPVTTLSGGESQRLKLAGYLAEFRRSNPATTKPTLFIFDEPTTGLHFDDVRVLLKVLHTLVDGGHSVLVVEHNLDVIKSADWIIDLGPEAGNEGGQLVVCGTPDQVAACRASHTGIALSQWISDHH